MAPLAPSMANNGPTCASITIHGHPLSPSITIMLCKSAAFNPGPPLTIQNRPGPPQTTLDHLGPPQTTLDHLELPETTPTTPDQPEPTEPSPTLIKTSH